MAVTPTPADLVRARALYEKLRSAPYRTEDKVADLNDIARALMEREAEVWLDAGCIAKAAGDLASRMGAEETAHGQLSLADAFKTHAAAIRKGK